MSGAPQTRRSGRSGNSAESPNGHDQSRTRAGHAAESLATLRRLALKILKRENSKKRGNKGKMLFARNLDAFALAGLLFTVFAAVLKSQHGCQVRRVRVYRHGL